MRKAHRRQHGGQDILCSMLSLVRQIDDLRFGSFALRYILEAVDGADDVSIAILDGLDVDERNAAHAVRPLNMDFLLAYRNAGAQYIGYGALMVRQERAVGAEHFVRSAKPFIGIAELGRPPP